MVKAEELFPVEHHYREYGSKLDDEGERMHKTVTLRDAQQVLGDDHVSS